MTEVMPIIHASIDVPISYGFKLFVIIRGAQISDLYTWDSWEWDIALYRSEI